MMSFIIQGIDLPKESIAVEIKFYIPNIIHSDNIYINGWEMPDQEISALFTAEHLKDIIQIPKGHGRLIDADELVKHLRKDPLFDLVERYGISGVIESRPTILEAEE